MNRIDRRQNERLASQRAAIRRLQTQVGTVVIQTGGATLDAAISSITYNTDQTVASVRYASGLTVSYTYNADGTVHTSTDGTTTRTFTYNPDGTVASVT